MTLKLILNQILMYSYTLTFPHPHISTSFILSHPHTFTWSYLEFLILGLALFSLKVHLLKLLLEGSPVLTTPQRDLAAKLII